MHLLPKELFYSLCLTFLIRRVARHGRLLNIKGKFLTKISETVIAECKDGYPELYPLPTFDGKIPSDIINVAERIWSVIKRIETSVFSSF